MVKAIDAASLPKPKFLYSPMVVAGPFLKTAGLVGIDITTGKLVAGGVGPESKCILRNLREAMSECGLQLHDMVSANIYLSDFQQFPSFNQEWEDFFSGIDTPPARTSVGVQCLPIDASIEMDFLFYASDLNAHLEV